jgi:hypothetical protein
MFVLVGCASDPETTAPDTTPAPCQSSVLFRDLDGNAALEAINQSRPIDIRGCIGSACFDERLAIWERIDGDYVAKTADAQRAQWQVRVTNSKNARLFVSVRVEDRIIDQNHPIALRAEIAPVVANESGLRRAQAVDERRLVTDSVTTFSNCE